jgi:hypothetical protein
MKPRNALPQGIWASFSFKSIAHHTPRNFSMRAREKQMWGSFLTITKGAQLHFLFSNYPGENSISENLPQENFNFNRNWPSKSTYYWPRLDHFPSTDTSILWKISY